MLSHTHNPVPPQGRKTPKRADPYYVAQDILSRRDHSEWEVVNKLERKGFPSPKIQEVVLWLKSKRLINDAEFARRYAASVLAIKPVGPLWVKQKLRLKHVPVQYIAAALDEAYAGSREKKAARQAAETWRRLHPKYAHDRQRLQRFLAARGFTPNTIYQILTQHH